MRANDNPNLVACLSWDQVAARIATGAAAILPVGAGAKQHGFHLPMGTDRIQAEALSGRLADHIDALIWPAISYGYYPAFAEYAGSCSLSAATFEALVEEIAAALAGYGCKAVFVLDTGISTIAPVRRALDRIGSDQILHLKIHGGEKYKAAARRIAQQLHGSHADELETSLMLALMPYAVDMARAEASPAIVREVAGYLTPSNPASPNYSRSGSFGDPTLATGAKGEQLLSAMMDDLVEQAKAFLTAAPASRRSGTGGS